MAAYDNHGALAPGLGEPHAHMDEPLGRPGREGFKDQSKDDIRDSAVPSEAGATDSQNDDTGHLSNRLATGVLPDLTAATDSPNIRAAMRARAAACGCALIELSDGTWLLSRWSLNRTLPDLRAVAAVIGRMEGRA